MSYIENRRPVLWKAKLPEAVYESAANLREKHKHPASPPAKIENRPKFKNLFRVIKIFSFCENHADYKINYKGNTDHDCNVIIGENGKS